MQLNLTNHPILQYLDVLQEKMQKFGVLYQNGLSFCPFCKTIGLLKPQYSINIGWLQLLPLPTLPFHGQT